MIFPLHLLHPRPAIIRGTPGEYSIEIPLAPFRLPLASAEPEDLEIETSIHLDFINLPSMKWNELHGRRFEFPVNPEDGYIDGSIYIEHAHHPVDVASIAFTDIHDGKLTARMTMRMLFEFEGLDEYTDTDAELDVEFLPPDEVRNL